MEQLTLDDIVVDDGPEDWDAWFASLPRIPGGPPPDESEDREAA